jgi:RHS repeat-associated protein
MIGPNMMTRVLAIVAALVGIGLSHTASAETIIGVAQQSYDVNLRPKCTAVRMNPAAFGAQPDACIPGTAGTDGPDRITLTEYDAVGQVKRVTRGYGVSPQVDKEVVAYTDNGLEQIVADGNGNRTTYEYDDFDRLSKVRYPNPICCESSASDYEAYGYDAAGNRTTWRKRGGETVTSSFDALNRMTYHDGVQTWFYYDNLGRPTATYAGAGAAKVTALSYDALGRVTWDYAKLNGALLGMNSQYDAAGRRTRLTWPDGFYITYDYDNAGAVTAIKENGASNLATYSYDDLGRRTAVSLANGANTQYAYDAASRLSALSLYLADPAKRQAYGFTYNAAGQVTSRTASNALYEWSETQGSRTYSVNGLNQYTAVGGGATGYDARGNMTSNGGVGYGYDLDNRLISTASGGALSYDPLGRLQETAAPNLQTKRLAYDGTNLVTEYDTANAILSRYVPGPGVDEPVVWYEGAGTSDRRFLMRDAQGSIISVSNNAGVSILTYAYDEYGVSSRAEGRFQYTGQIWLPEVGVYHYKARAYSPTLGRFLQTDPIGYGDGLNWYAYTYNDPINHTDPTGTIVPLVIAGVCAAGGCEAAAGAVLVAGVIIQQNWQNSGAPQAMERWVQDAIHAMEPSFTPDGREIRQHGPKTSGDDYIKTKGHTGQQVDDIINGAVDSYDTAKGDHRKGTGAKAYVDKSGNFVVVNDKGQVIQVNDRGNKKQPPPERKPPEKRGNKK